ncbi:unnamed protein product [Lota lota]
METEPKHDQDPSPANGRVCKVWAMGPGLSAERRALRLSSTEDVERTTLWNLCARSFAATTSCRRVPFFSERRPSGRSEGTVRNQEPPPPLGGRSSSRRRHGNVPLMSHSVTTPAPAPTLDLPRRSGPGEEQARTAAVGNQQTSPDLRFHTAPLGKHSRPSLISRTRKPSQGPAIKAKGKRRNSPGRAQSKQPLQRGQGQAADSLQLLQAALRGDEG